MKKFSSAILIVLLVAVLALFLVACGDNNSDDEPVPTPDEIIHADEYYNGLTEQEKVSFDNKLNTIIASSEYNAMSDEDKISLLNRLVESEKLIKEVALENEQNAEAFDNVKKELSSFSNELLSLFDSNGSFIEYFNNLIDENLSGISDFLHSDAEAGDVSYEELLESLKESVFAYIYYELLYLENLKEKFNFDIASMQTSEISSIAEKLNSYISELNTKKKSVEYEEGRGITYVIEIIQSALQGIDNNAGYYTVKDVYNAINIVKGNLQLIIDSTISSAEEIASAQEKLGTLKSLEQEYVYFETILAGKEIIDNDSVLHATNPGISLRRICDIYKYGGVVYVNADLIKTEQICGVDFSSQFNAFCRFTGSSVSKDPTYAEIIASISNANGVHIEYNCTNKNADWHKEYFENNKYSISDKNHGYEELGYTFTVVESWENGDSEHPEYIVKSKREDNEQLYICQYLSEGYSCQIINKICLEFWAYVERNNIK